MKYTVYRPIELDIKYVYIVLPLRNEDDMAPDAPCRIDNRWAAVIDIETGQIESWPGGALEIQLKVVDTGSYFLYDEDYTVLAEIRNDYVPNRLIPGNYGDYVYLNIDADGKILNWPKNPNVVDFFKNEL